MYVLNVILFEFVCGCKFACFVIDKPKRFIYIYICLCDLLANDNRVRNGFRSSTSLRHINYIALDMFLVHSLDEKVGLAVVFKTDLKTQICFFIW